MRLPPHLRQRKTYPAGTIWVKLHRWRRSPYAYGDPYEPAVEVLYVLDGKVKTSLVYLADGSARLGAPLAQSRTTGTRQDCARLLAALERSGLSPRVVTGTNPLMEQNPDRWTKLSQLPKQLPFERQRAVRTARDWSDDLLEPSLQAALRELLTVLPPEVAQDYEVHEAFGKVITAAAGLSFRRLEEIGKELVEGRYRSGNR